MQDFITQIIESVGYGGIALLMLLEVVLPFIPSELVMPFAGFSAASGELSLLGVMAAGSVGSVAGATLLYLLARRIDNAKFERWISRHGKWAGLGSKDLDRANGWFDKHANWAVLGGRLVPGLRSVVSVPAGLRRMAWPAFLLCTAVGSVIWTALLAWAGYSLEQQYEQIGSVVTYISYAVAAILVGVIVTFVIRRRSM